MESKNFSPGVSVIVCCYNSARRLKETIKYISFQEFDNSIDLEVIIVDNNSTDKTVEVAKTELDQYPNLKSKYLIVEEKVPGLNNARKKGIFTAKYEIILFCDDDNWLDSRYVENIYNIFNSNERLGIVGAGNAYGEYETEPPKWFFDYKHLYAIVENVNQDIIGFQTSDQYMAFGAGMGIRKSLAIEYFIANKENIILDRTAQLLLSGGDTDMNYFVLSKGFGIGKFASLTFKHYMPNERLTKAYIKRLAYGLSYSSVLVSKKNNEEIVGWHKLGFLKHFCKLLFSKGSFHCSILLIQHRGFRDAVKNKILL